MNVNIFLMVRPDREDVFSDLPMNTEGENEQYKSEKLLQLLIGL